MTFKGVLPRLFAAAVLSAAAPALAAEPTANPKPRVELYVCDPADAPARYRRTAFSSRQFVTAEQVLAGGEWRGAARCIRPDELQKLRTLRPAALRDVQVAALR